MGFMDIMLVFVLCVLMYYLYIFILMVILYVIWLMYYGVNLRELKYGILLEFVYIIDLISFLLWLDYDYYLIVFNVWVYNLLLIVSFFEK